MAYRSLYRKWRPQTFEDIVGQEHITNTLKNEIVSGHISHAYLFCGSRGTGKTTTAKVFAKAVNCESPVSGSPCNKCRTCRGISDGSLLDVVEMDAASNNSVENIREINEEVSYLPSGMKYKVYIVDEVHMLSTQAFNALLQILEEPPAHLMFILATTEIHKVPATIKSRCQQFSFKRIRAEEIASRLAYVAGQEGIDLTEEGGALLARLADGGMRDALSLLDQCRGSGGVVDEERVYTSLGLAGNLEAAALMEHIADGDAAAALERLGRLYAGGKEMAALVGELAGLTRDLLIRRTAPRAGSALMTGGFDETTLKALERRFDVPRLVQMLNLLQKTAADVVRSSNRRTDVELCLVTLCDPTLDTSAAGLNARISRLEQGIVVSAAPVSAPVSRPEPVPAPRPKAEPAMVQKADLPPWEVEEPVSTAKPAPRAESVPSAPAAKPRAAAPAGGWPGWCALRDALKGEIGMGDYIFLSNADMVGGCLEGDTLTLWAANDFIKGMIDKQSILEKVAAKAAALAGRAVRVTVKVGVAPPERPAGAGAPSAPEEPDALEAFLAEGFDNLIVE